MKLEMQMDEELEYLPGMRQDEKHKELMKFMDALVKTPKQYNAVDQFLAAEILMQNTIWVDDAETLESYKIYYESYDETGYEIDQARLDRDKEKFERDHEAAAAFLEKAEKVMKESGISRADIDRFKMDSTDLKSILEDVRREDNYLKYVASKQAELALAQSIPEQEPVVVSKGITM